MRRLILSLAIAVAAVPAAARDVLLVGNKGEDTMSFIDLTTGAELGRAATGRMPHEIAVSPNGREAAVVAYGARAIDIFDVATRARLRSIDLAPNDGPHGLAWLTDGRIVATTERSRSIVVVDTRDAVTSVATDQPGTHMIAVSPDRRQAYTANMAAGTVSLIDLLGMRKVRDLRVGGTPEGIALSVDGRTLWVADLDNARVQAFDTRKFGGRPLATVATGARPIRVLASPDGRWIVTSNHGDGSLTVIDARARRPARTIAISGERAAEQVTILFSADGKRIYAAETGRNRVAEVDFASGRVLRRVAAGKQGDGLAIATIAD